MVKALETKAENRSHTMLRLINTWLYKRTLTWQYAFKAWDVEEYEPNKKGHA